MDRITFISAWHHVNLAWHIKPQWKNNIFVWLRCHVGMFSHSDSPCVSSECIILISNVNHGFLTCFHDGISWFVIHVQVSFKFNLPVDSIYRPIIMIMLWVVFVFVLTCLLFGLVVGEKHRIRSDMIRIVISNKKIVLWQILPSTLQCAV